MAQPGSFFKRHFSLRNVLLFVGMIGTLAYPLWYASIIASAKQGWGGDNPSRTVLAVLPGSHSATRSGCDSVLQTPQGLWVFTDVADYWNQVKIETALSATPPALDFMTLLDEKSKPGKYSGKQLILSADTKGAVRYSGVVPDNACADLSHDGRTLWLRTMLDRAPASETADSVYANFRSSDHGKSWQLENRILSPIPDPLPFEYRVFFPSENERWVLYEDERDTITPGSPRRLLAYSADQGSNWQYPVSTATLPIPERFIAPLRRHGQVVFNHNELTLTPLSADQYLLWQSVALTTLIGDRYYDHETTFTQLVTLNRKGEGWQATPAVVSAELYLKNIQQGSDGQIFGVKVSKDEEIEQLWQFDPAQQRWEKRSDAPNPFDPLPASRIIDTLRAGKGLLLIYVIAEHNTASSMPNQSGTITASAYYYSTDQGRSWRKLHMGRYDTFDGFDAQNNRIFGLDRSEQNTQVTARTLGK